MLNAEHVKSDHQAVANLRSQTKRLRDWRAIRLQLEKAVKKGLRKKTFHPGKKSKFHTTEVRLHIWIVRKCNKRIAVLRL